MVQNIPLTTRPEIRSVRIKVRQSHPVAIFIRIYNDRPICNPYLRYPASSHKFLFFI